MDEEFYCTNCSSTVDENDNYCRVCGADLNDKNEPKEEVNEPETNEEPAADETITQNRTVVVKTFQDEFSSEIAKQALADRGITSIISNDDAGGLNPSSKYLMHIRLLVLEKDLRMAKKILKIGESKDSDDSFSSEMIDGLAAVVYHVDNIEKGKDWYTRALEVIPYIDEPYYVGFKIGEFELGVDPNAENSQVKDEGHVAFWSVTNIEETFKHLLLIGAQRQDDITDIGGGILAATVIDPFGNTFGLMENKNLKIKY